jgi:hypothetical protein
MTAEPERIASLGLDEFRRHLPYALRGLSWHWRDHRTARVETLESTITISVEEMAPLRLSGLLALPRLRVAFTFDGGDETTRAAFLATYDRAFQRGGG